MSTQAHPVYLRRTDVDPLVGSMTLSLWHGVRFKKWSDEPTRTMGEFRVADVDAADVGPDILSNHFDGYRPISISGSGAGAALHFYVCYGRKSNEAPLQRRWIVRSASSSQSPAARVTAADHNAAPPANAVDKHIKNYMQFVGARHAQVVVVRRGQLRYARAYTWAEDGYPICTLDHALRVGSVSKPLTSIVAFASVVPNLSAGADTIVTEPPLLGYTRHEGPTLLRSVTLRHLLQHRSALRDGANTQQDAIAVTQEVPAQLISGALSASPGAMYQLMATRDDNVFMNDLSPGASPCGYYTNDNYVLASVAIARNLAGDPANFSEACEVGMSAFGVRTRKRPGVLFATSSDRSSARKESPPFSDYPGAGWAKTDMEPLPVVSDPFTVNPNWDTGAGGWCVPLKWIAKIMSGLHVSLAGLGVLTRAQLLDLAGVPGAGTDPITGQSCGLGEASGFGRSADRFAFKRSASARRPLIVEQIALSHNGLQYGGSAYLQFRFPKTVSPSTFTYTLGYCVAFSQQSNIAFEEGSSLIDAIVEMEDLDLWDAGDLFDLLSL